MIKAPKANKALYNIIIGFRPKLSDNGPAIREPGTEPRFPKDTVKARSLMEIFGQVSLRYSYALAITPKSYPNKNPPMEPTAINNIINLML